VSPDEELERQRLDFERKQYCLPCRNSILLRDDARCDGCLWAERICGHDCYWLILDMEGKT
jgi:hypothetical protein